MYAHIPVISLLPLNPGVYCGKSENKIIILSFAEFAQRVVQVRYLVQSTFVISKTMELSEILRAVRTSIYQINRTEEKNKLNNDILQMNM